MKTPDRQILSNLSKNMSAHYISIYSDNSTKRKLFSKNEEIKWDRENPYLFLEDLRRNDAKMEIEMCVTECLGQIQLREMGKTVNSHKNLRENWKRFKTDRVFAKHAIFATEVSRQQVARSSCQNTQRQNFEKFSKCFSWLKGLPAKESRAEPWKSLCTPRDWTLHSRTSRQT